MSRAATFPLVTEAYPEQRRRWPQTGRHILAQFDETGIVVYQAYRPAIGKYAAAHGRFGGEFSLSRMSWIKPNFLWMMYRCGWATKVNQETVLAVKIRRDAFDSILADAVHSSFVPEVYESPEAWEKAVAASSVRLQWDPDHSPTGERQERRAIQIGLRGEFLRRYADEWILRIDDLTQFVGEQAAHVAARNYERLMLPREEVYPVTAAAVAAKLGLSPCPPERNSKP